MIGDLPEHLTVGNIDYPIRSDYRNVLQIFEAFNDQELTHEEKWIVAIYLLFEDFSCADDVFDSLKSGFNVEDAANQIIWFILMGKEGKDKKELPIYDWEYDEQMIFSSVNKVAGKEIRELPYLHWWTFLGYFNEIGEGIFSFILGIRSKLNKGNKLEKYERDFFNNNKELVKLKKRKTKEEMQEEAERRAILDEIL